MEFEQKVRKYANDLVDFLRECGSSFAAAKKLKKKLQKNGLHLLEEEKEWDLKKNEGYVVCRQNRNVFSFFIGKNFNFKDGAILVTAGHLDSPCLRLTPNNHVIRNKIHQLNVETYGGGLWGTWFDRCLGLSGQVLYKKGNAIEERIVQINKPLFIVPSLAIHLQSINEYPIKVDYEKHLKPIAATAYVHELKQNEKEREKTKEKGTKNEKEPGKTKEKGTTQEKKKKNKEAEDEEVGAGDLALSASEGLITAPTVLHVLAKELNCKEEAIVDFELCLFDSENPCLCGVYEEFLASGRLDNLAGTYGTFEAFIEFVNDIKKDTSTNNKHNNLYICIGFDNEEIGSHTEVGAKSYLTKNFIDRIISSIFMEQLKTQTVEQIYGQLLSRSMLINVDMAHGVHPNYLEHTHPLHKVYFQEGLVIKYHAGKNYVTSPYYVRLLKATFELHEKYKEEKIKFQHFIVKNTVRCGSSLGPMLAYTLGLPGVDIGIPQLAMHSVREIMSIYDIYYLVKGIQAFYNNYHEARTSFSDENIDE